MKRFSHWDEFQWENEIRQHEELVADYFQDLVYCLDLPAGTMPVAVSGSVAPSDPVTAKQTDALKKWMTDHEENDADDTQTEYEPRHPVCFSCVDSLDQLAVIWNQFAVTHYSGEHFAFVLGITCGFAKLLARVADFTEPSKESSYPLLLSLGKRSLCDLEDLVSRLNEYSQNIPENSKEIDFFCLRLALLRDQLINKICEIRNQIFD